MKSTLSPKKFWMSIVVAIMGVSATMLFPTDDGVQDLLAGIVFLCLLPWLYVKFFLKEGVANFGFSMGKVGIGIFSAVSGIMFSIILVGFMVHFDMLAQYFTVPLSVKLSFLSFLIFVSILGVYIGIMELFFRGFVQSVLENRFGAVTAIFGQTLFMCILVLISNKLDISFITGLIALSALISGFIRYYSRSVLYSFIFSCISAILGVVSIIMFVK